MRPVTTAIAARIVRPATVSLFDRIGGRSQVAALVARFQRRLFADEDLARQLAPLGAALDEGLTAFLIRALDGPVGEAARAQSQPPDPLSVWLDVEPFTRVVAHLWMALLDLDLPTDLKDQVVVAIILRALRPTPD